MPGDAFSNSPVSGRRRLVLLGAGHAHLYSLKKAPEFVRRGYELVVVAPENFWYSGLATGVLGGGYRPEEDQIDVEELTKRGGAGTQFLRAQVVTIDPSGRAVHLEDGRALGYDVLSVNLGSEVRALPGEQERVFPIKPLRRLWELRQDLEAAAAAADNKPRVVIVGAGPSGCEIASNVRALLGLGGGEITLLGRTDRIVPGFSAGAARTLGRWLKGQGIQIHLQTALARIENRVAITEVGERHPFDFLVNATGLHAPEMLAVSGLSVSDRGELLVDEFLRSTNNSRVFGGGDCVKVRGRDLEKNGVYAVREAPVLFHNLLASLGEGSMRAYHPQRHCLLILNLGRGMGMARWRGLHWVGRPAYWLKDRIDRSFLDRYRKAD